MARLRRNFRGPILIGTFVPISSSDINVATSLVLGIAVHFLFSELLLGSSSRAANALVLGTRNHIDAEAWFFCKCEVDEMHG